jgi:putative membrane protein
MNPEQHQPSDEERKQRAVDLAIERTELAEGRTELARERTELAQERTVLAEKRTLMAQDRTLMAWIRTAVAMIGIAVGIYEVVVAVRGEGSDELDTASIAAAFLVGLGIFGLTGASVHFWLATTKLGRDLYPAWKFTFSFACVIIVVGVLLIIGLILGRPFAW